MRRHRGCRGCRPAASWPSPSTRCASQGPGAERRRPLPRRLAVLAAFQSTKSGRILLGVADQMTRSGNAGRRATCREPAVRREAAHRCVVDAAVGGSVREAVGDEHLIIPNICGTKSVLRAARGRGAGHAEGVASSWYEADEALGQREAARRSRPRAADDLVVDVGDVADGDVVAARAASAARRRTRPARARDRRGRVVDGAYRTYMRTWPGVIGQKRSPPRSGLLWRRSCSTDMTDWTQCDGRNGRAAPTAGPDRDEQRKSGAYRSRQSRAARDAGLSAPARCR